jgi:hypothetical protein
MRPSNQEEIVKTSILFIAGALVLGGCASSQARQQPTTAEPEASPPAAEQEPGMRGGMMGGEMAGMCPMAVEGTTARAEDVEGGAAMVFTTTGDVSELRRRVARMAQMHNRHHGEGHGHMRGARGGSRGHQHGRAQDGDEPAPGGMQGGMGMMGGGMMPPPSTARSEEVEGGARLVLTPRDPADLARLREHVGQHGDMMASGRCPMMSNQHGQGSEATSPSEPNEHEAHHPKDGE